LTGFLLLCYPRSFTWIYPGSDLISFFITQWPKLDIEYLAAKYPKATYVQQAIETEMGSILEKWLLLPFGLLHSSWLKIV